MNITIFLLGGGGDVWDAERLSSDERGQWNYKKKMVDEQMTKEQMVWEEEKKQRKSRHEALRQTILKLNVN